MITQVFVEYTKLPSIMRLGLLVFAIGAGLDLIFHASPVSWEGTLEIYLGADAIWAHSITLVGMVLTLVGIIVRK